MLPDTSGQSPQSLMTDLGLNLSFPDGKKLWTASGIWELNFLRFRDRIRGWSFVLCLGRTVRFGLPGSGKAWVRVVPGEPEGFGVVTLDGIRLDIHGKRIISDNHICSLSPSLASAHP